MKFVIKIFMFIVLGAFFLYALPCLLLIALGFTKSAGRKMPSL